MYIFLRFCNILLFKVSFIHTSFSQFQLNKFHSNCSPSADALESYHYKKGPQTLFPEPKKNELTTNAAKRKVETSLTLHEIFNGRKQIEKQLQNARLLISQSSHFFS